MKIHVVEILNFLHSFVDRIKTTENQQQQFSLTIYIINKNKHSTNNQILNRPMY